MTYQQLKERAALGEYDTSMAFRSDCRKWLECELGELTDQQFERMFNFAWDHCHSADYVEVVDMLRDLTFILDTFIVRRR